MLETGLAMRVVCSTLLRHQDRLLAASSRCMPPVPPVGVKIFSYALRRMRDVCFFSRISSWFSPALIANCTKTSAVCLSYARHLSRSQWPAPRPALFHAGRSCCVRQLLRKAKAQLMQSCDQRMRIPRILFAGFPGIHTSVSLCTCHGMDGEQRFSHSTSRLSLMLSGLSCYTLLRRSQHLPCGSGYTSTTVIASPCSEVRRRSSKHTAVTDADSRARHPPAMLALLAIGFLLLCETVLILIGEHFNSAIDRWGRRHRGFIHLLTALLVGAFVAAVIYACWVGGRNLDNTVQAYIVLLIIFLGLLLLHQIFRTPHLTYYQTTMMLLFVVRRPVSLGQAGPADRPDLCRPLCLRYVRSTSRSSTLLRIFSQVSLSI